MRIIRTSLAVTAILGIAAALSPSQAGAQEEKPKAQYIGVEACGKCHKRKSTGDQLGQWMASKHAKALATLASEEAKKIATAKGIADPQKEGACLKCHVTGHGIDPSLIMPPAEGKKGFLVEEGVQCEACHGAGSLYEGRKVMKSREQSVANGLIIPDEKTCLTCHNKESPTFVSFDYKEAVKKIAHPNPEKQAPAK